MGKPINRRDLFAGTAAVGAALALPLPHGAIALQAQSRPDAALEAAWQRIVAAADTLDVIGVDFDTEAERDQYAIMDEAENFIQSTTAQTPHGAAIQLWLAL
ncbi:twin-arginine translocation signal domain-containing protein [Pelagerythrobacter aerophilus]|uniref:twin-arginine translocation signal domain-containing protein n=1 Tax=Pelagerythrobacter aerophilus TaxID=2306995 RepID=UPI001E30D30E|nr:twin-arginine translocation signal domain-containing protein [Pelagerythrobacter aerophilus]